MPKRKPVPRPERPKRYDKALDKYIRDELEKYTERGELKKEIIERIEADHAYTNADIVNLKGHIKQVERLRAGLSLYGERNKEKLGLTQILRLEKLIERLDEDSFTTSAIIKFAKKKFRKLD